MTLSRSVNEIVTLARKAAIGAGFPPAQAESFGEAAAAHLALGGDPQALLDALRDVGDSPVLRLPLVMEDVLRALAVAGPEVTLTLQTGDEALAPAYVACLPVAVTRSAVETQGGLARLTVCAETRISPRAALPPRIETPQALMNALSRLAARTLVPATAASRAKGAGAGDIDND